MQLKNSSKNSLETRQSHFWHSNILKLSLEANQLDTATLKSELFGKVSRHVLKTDNSTTWLLALQQVIPIHKWQSMLSRTDYWVVGSISCFRNPNAKQDKSILVFYLPILQINIKYSFLSNIFERRAVGSMLALHRDKKLEYRLFFLSLLHLS